MGALHAGHISLITACKSQNDVTVSSIFVNPIQFNNQNDLLKYPRSIEKDTSLLASAGCDVLFCPDNSEMYPKAAAVTIDFGSLDKSMEGKFRPGHFSGVAVVVAKLLNIVDPDQAYFGQKDWQQFAIIRKLVQDLNFNIRLHSVPTLRESDGLALSSRNLRLDATQRKRANVFYQGLMQAKQSLGKGIGLTEIRDGVRSVVEQYPDVKLEYFEVVDRENLIALTNVGQTNNAIICIAGYVGDVRLIDNMFLE
jgi:pantoate--beta-alanine ligase